MPGCFSPPAWVGVSELNQNNEVWFIKLIAGGKERKGSYVIWSKKKKSRNGNLNVITQKRGSRTGMKKATRTSFHPPSHLQGSRHSCIPCYQNKAGPRKRHQGTSLCHEETPSTAQWLHLLHLCWQCWSSIPIHREVWWTLSLQQAGADLLTQL